MIFSNDAVVFQQKLDYNKASGTGNAQRLDGLITSNRWQHFGSEPERAYNFTYNIPKRLIASSYRQKSVSTWSSSNFYNEDNIVYSANGNITALRRNSNKSGAASQIDNLSYTYSGNRLMRVADSAPLANRPDGFDDLNTNGDDYVYNQNGFVTIDSNKNITEIIYNILDRPTRVTFRTGVNIRYTYSSGGGLQTVTYHSTVNGTPTKTLQYVGELVFENGVLTDINHEYGRVLANNGFKYQYYLTDYLGSTRVVLQEDPEVFTSSAGFEYVSMNEESEQFIGYDEVVRISADMLNHTPGEESSFAMRLTGGYGENMGLAKSVSVMPGDTVRFEVYGKYIDIGEAKRNPAVMAVLMAITAADPVGMGVDGGLATTMRSQSNDKVGLASLLTSRKEIGDAPPAYLNYLFFDSEMNYKYGGFVQMSNAAREDGSNVAHERLAQEVVAEEPEYFYIYLSNDSNTGSEAFSRGKLGTSFDDFTIMTSESYIVQQIDYYPYGMVAREFRRLGDKATNDLFQGKTYEELTKWHDFHARQYDAALGRWFGVDPQDQFASPYLAMGNNPVMMVDPDGELAWFIPIIAGAVINTALNAKNINNVWDALGYAAVGAAAGAIGGGVGMHVGAGLKVGGFMAGAISGAAGGASGGFVSGFGNTAVGGGNLGESLKAGVLGAGIGGLSGGILGGLTSGIASSLKGTGFWDGTPDMSRYLLACSDCAASFRLPTVTVLGKYNPVAAGVYQAGASFWAHPVTNATVFAATSVIGGGIASQFLRASSRAANIGNVARSGMNQVQYAAKGATGFADDAARGVIQASNGLKVTGFTGHGVNRAIGSAGRLGVKPNAILDALKNPLKINNVVTDQLGRQSQRFIGQFGEVVVNPRTGRIISVNPTSSSKAAKLLKQLGR